MSRAAVQELAQRFIKALIAGDMPALLDCYDDDIVFEAPGLPMILGKAGVEKHYRMVFGLNVTACRQVPERIEERADCVIEAGSYVMNLSPPGAGPIEDRGKYLLVYRQTGGKWRMWFDMVHSDTSATVAGG